MARSRVGLAPAMAALVWVISCAPSPVARFAGRPETAKPVAAAPRRVVSKRTRSGPPPAITTPMQGDPAGSTLAEARLVDGQCADEPEVIEERIKQMKREVNEQFALWHAEQPACWHQYRQNAEMWKQGTWGGMWGDAIGESFGAGGLGLSGIGEGGGGYSEGLGLGSVGTIGHGSGQGFGSGQGVGSDGAPRRAKSASGTNVQVVGVDEADIVKTDGQYVYLAANGALRILEALNPKVVSVTKVSGVIRDLFVDGDRAVVYSSSSAPAKACTYGYDCRFAGDGTSTHITVFDIESRKRPKAVRKIALSGSLMTSRRLGNTVHTVVADGDSAEPLYATWPTDLAYCGTPESVVKERFAALKRQNAQIIRETKNSMPTITEGGQTRQLCDNLLRTRMGDGKAYTTIVSFDLTDTKPASTEMIQSRPGAVFASADALYLSVVHQKQGGPWYSFYPSVDEVSEVHKFRIGAEPSATRYVGSGVVPGHVLNQFAMDEWYGYLRIATTRGQVPDPNVDSVLSVLAEGENDNLVRVGAVSKIAPGEDIRAVRFDDDRGYIVTFKKTDPLFVIDLHDPAEPAIVGELKIPGFSTYIHRIDDTHLLSIGFDANDHGDFAYFDGVILQLFDVTDPTDPKLTHKEKIGTRGSSSEAATNHLAFNYLAETGMLAFPMTICEGGGDGSDGQDLTFSGLLVYDVDVEKGFKRLGGINHGTVGANCGTWWSNATSLVQRSVFLDDLVYSIAPDRLKVQRVGHFGEDFANIALMP